MANKIFGHAQKVTCPIPNGDSTLSIKQAIIGQLHLMHEQHASEMLKVMSIFVGNKGYTNCNSPLETIRSI